MRSVTPALVGGLALGALACPSVAHAGWLGNATAVEQRVALAAGAGRAVVWSELRLRSSGGAFALVVPVRQGAAVDRASDAWLEALEVASAVRVLPPSGAEPQCPGAAQDHRFEVVGALDHLPALEPVELEVLEDGVAVATWAVEQGLAVPGQLAGALGALDEPCVVLLFEPPSSDTPTLYRTPTLRVTFPEGVTPELPLGLGLAPTTDDVLMTSFVVGEGRGALASGTLVTVDPATVAWRASSQSSSYDDRRREELGDASAWLVEQAGHEALFENLPFDNGTASIDGAVPTYFVRADEYDDAVSGAAACIAQVVSLASSNEVVAQACPAGALAEVGGPLECLEEPSPSGLDPALLRCGAADDLALALAGKAPARAALTRITSLLPSGQLGQPRAVTLTTGLGLEPIVRAGTVELSGCDGPDGGGNAGNGSGSGSGNGSNGLPPTGSGSSGDVDLYIPDEGCSCSDTTPPVDTSDPDYEEVVYEDSGDDCDDGEGCDDGDSSYEGDDCDCEGADDAGGESCDCEGGDDAGEACDSGGEACDAGGDAADGCDCSVRSPKKRKRPRSFRVSVLTYAAFTLWLPLRRWGTRKRREARKTRSPGP